MRTALLGVATTLLLAGCAVDTASEQSSNVPSWAADAVWYQIFPERFRNGDPTNDPVRASLPNADRMPESWALTPWTADWYDYCADRYRSFKPRNGTYTGYDGQQHFCVAN